MRGAKCCRDIGPDRLRKKGDKHPKNRKKTLTKQGRKKGGWKKGRSPLFLRKLVNKVQKIGSKRSRYESFGIP